MKICHYVPQFYLKNFSISGKTGYVHAYRRKSKPFEPSIRNVAAKNDLYVFRNKDTGKKDYQIEKEFSWLEVSTAPIIEKINTGTPLLEFTNREHIVLSDFIVFLHVRNLSFREKQKNLTSVAIEMLLKSIAQDEDGFRKRVKDIGYDLEGVDELRKYALNFNEHFYIDWDKKNNDYFLTQALLLAEKIAPLIFYKEWHVIDNKTSEVFLTSDNPVTLMRPHNHPAFYGLGFANSHIVVPTSPTKALLLKFSGEKIDRPRIIQATRDFINYVNKHVRFYAHRFVYTNIRSEDIENDFNRTEDGKSEKLVVN